MQQFLLVGLGGAAGSILRFAGQQLLPFHSFPTGTLLVNLTGCFVIGILWGLLQKNGLNNEARLLLMTGFCGGFTTFSSFTYESLLLVNNQRWTLFLLYTGLSIAGGFLTTFLGFKLTY